MVSGMEYPRDSVPILVIEGNDIAAFESLNDALNWIEAIDALDDVYEVYDAAGRLLTLRAESDTGPVTLSGIDEDPRHREELRARLIRFFELVDPARYGMTKEAIRRDPLLEVVQQFLRAERGRPSFVKRLIAGAVSRIRT